MSSASYVFSQSIGRKLVMALSGLFLVSFLFVHMSGNLLLFKGDGGVAFNEYTRFMTTTPLIKALEWVLFGGFIIHVVYAAILTRQNRQARPVQYAYLKNQSKSSSWFSRNMGWSGTIVLLFLVIHLIMFWGFFHFGAGEKVSVDTAFQEVWKVTEAPAAAKTLKNEIGDPAIDKKGYITREGVALLKANNITEVEGVSMQKVVEQSFSQWYIVLFYTIAMVLLGFHLNHGFQSAFRTVGFTHRKYTPLIVNAGTAIAIIVPFVFTTMPIWYFIQSLA